MPPPDDSPALATELKMDLPAVKAKPPSRRVTSDGSPPKVTFEPPTLKHSERRRLQLQNELLEQEVSRLWWDKYTRLASCVAIFTVVIGWLWAVRQLLVLPATERPTDAVLIAALGTTTVNVLGLLYIVARYLFPQQMRAELSPKSTAE